MKKRIFALLMVFFILAAMMPYTVMAKSGMNTDIAVEGTELKPTMTFYHYGKSSSDRFQAYSNEHLTESHKIPANASAVRVINSSKAVSVQKVTWTKGSSLCTIKLRINRTGSARIKVIATVNGEKRTVDSAFLKIYNYKNPVTGFIVGKKNYAPYFSKAAGVYSTKKYEDTYPVYVKAASGWTIKSIRACLVTEKDGYVTAAYKTLKNNSGIPLKDLQSASIFLTLYNKAAKTEQHLTVDIKTM